MVIRASRDSIGESTSEMSDSRKLDREMRHEVASFWKEVRDIMVPVVTYLPSTPANEIRGKYLDALPKLRDLIESRLMHPFPPVIDFPKDEDGKVT